MSAANKKGILLDTDEAAEVARMMEECLAMIQDAFEKIDALLAKIDSILAREKAFAFEDDELIPNSICSGDLSLDELEVLMHGTQKLEP